MGNYCVHILPTWTDAQPNAYGELSVLPKAAMADYHTSDGLDNKT